MADFVMPGREPTSDELRRLEQAHARAVEAEQAARARFDERNQVLAELYGGGLTVIRLAQALGMSEQATRAAIKRGSDQQ